MKNLIKNNRSFIRAIIRKSLGDANEDIEQEVYIKAWQSSESYSEQGKLKNWLSVITKNKCRDYIRSSVYKLQSKSNAIEDDDLSIDAEQVKSIELKQRQKIILKEVYSLPKELSKVIVLFEFEELSYDQISTKLKISIPVVKNRLHSARKILADKLHFLKGN